MISAYEDAAFTFSAHAETRMAQRGIRRTSLDLLLFHGTRSKAQRDCEEYVLSARTAQQLEVAGYDREEIAAATRVRAIVDANGTIVTCYHQRSGRSRPSGRKPRFRTSRQA